MHRTPEVEMFSKRIGKRLRSIRQSKGFSVAVLSEISGVSKRAIDEYESGQDCPMLSTAHLLCLALTIKLDDLVYGFDREDRVQKPKSPRLRRQLCKTTINGNPVTVVRKLPKKKLPKKKLPKKKLPKPFLEKRGTPDGKSLWWERRNNFEPPPVPEGAKEFGWRAKIKPVPSRSEALQNKSSQNHENAEDVRRRTS